MSLQRAYKFLREVYLLELEMRRRNLRSKTDSFFIVVADALHHAGAAYVRAGLTTAV